MSKQCYYPDGSESGDVPCDPTASVSACCGNQASCIVGHICNWGGVTYVDNYTFRYAAGSCTDQNWESDACFDRSYCHRSFFLPILLKLNGLTVGFYSTTS